MSLFKKSRKNFRRRIDEDDEEENNVKGSAAEEDENGEPFNVEIKPPKPPKIAKEKKPEKSKTTLLSFEEDLNEGDDGEVFKVKKSSQSKKMMKLMDRERKKKKDVKKEDTDGDIPGINVKIEQVPDSPVILKETVLNGRAAEMAGVGDLSSDEEERHPKFARPNHVKLMLERGHIPDAAMIHAARKRRQQARDNGNDYIPVSSTTTRAKVEEKSRLIREDDEASDDEDEERIEMEVNKAKRERELRRETFLAAQDEDSDKMEEDEWESQQIRKGVTGAQPFDTQHTMRSFSLPPRYSQLAAVQQEALYSVYPTPAPVMAASIPEDVLMERKTEADTPESVVNNLRERLANLKSINEQQKKTLDGVVAEMVATNCDRTQLEKEAPALAARFRFYQEMRGYVTDLVECLDEKVPVIEALEERVLALLRRRAEDLMERRRQDVRDQAEDLAPVTRGGVTTRRPREDSEARVRRVAEREGRRTRRRRQRETAATLGNLRHQDGMSSDDEVTDVELNAFRAQMQQAETDRRLVFADVTDEFASLREVSKRFEQWRAEDGTAYREAYVSLCVPKVLGPIIRVKLLFWSPLENESVELEGSDWFDALAQYGLGGSEDEGQLRADPDLLLIPRVVEKMLLPKTTRLVEAQWDPVSTSQTLRLVKFVKRLVTDFPSIGPPSKPLTQLFRVIVDKLKAAVEQDVFIPLYPKMPEGRANPSGASAFAERQFGAGVKLLRNALAWHGVLGDAALCDTARSALLNRYLLVAVRGSEPIDAAAKCLLIASTFPRAWFAETAPIAQLQPFVTQSRHVAKQLDRSLPATREQAERIEQIADALAAN